MSYFNQIGKYYKPEPLYEEYREKNQILEKENMRLTNQIQGQLRSHLVMSSMSKPCGLKEGYSNLLASSFCSKQSPQSPIGTTYFGKTKSYGFYGIHSDILEK